MYKINKDTFITSYIRTFTITPPPSIIAFTGLKSVSLAVDYPNSQTVLKRTDDYGTILNSINISIQYIRMATDKKLTWLIVWTETT